MKYLGSKKRIAKYILPIILKDRKERGLFHEETEIQPSIGSNYIEVCDTSFRLISKNEYLRKTK